MSILTRTQLRTEVYNALNSNVNIPDADWLSQPDIDAEFPRVVYSILDASRDYSFNNGNIKAQSSDVIFQIDVYSIPGQASTLDTIIDNIESEMESINYMEISGGGEFESVELQTINAIQTITRWRRINA